MIKNQEKNRHGYTRTAEVLEALGFQTNHLKTGKLQPRLEIRKSNGRQFCVKAHVLWSKGTWQPGDLTTFLEIEQNGDYQNVIGIKSPPRDNIIFVFLDLRDMSKPVSYALPWAEVARIAETCHVDYLQRHGGKRPDNPQSRHWQLKVSEIDKWKDNWTVFDQ